MFIFTDGHHTAFGILFITTAVVFLPWLVGWLLRDRRKEYLRHYGNFYGIDVHEPRRAEDSACPVCDSLNRPSARFCRHCGAELDELI